jgi:calcineurin-like phosphoesterase family protein
VEKIWFTSDNHFGHKNIKNFCPSTRKGATVEEMDQLMIEMWQAQVAPEDRVYTLGDVFFCDAVRARSIMRQLPGQKHLIYGNHDKVIKSNKDLRDMFIAVHDYHELHLDGIKVILFHYPIWEWDQLHRGSYHLFGHVHGNTTVPGRAVDVGIDGELSSGDMSLYSWERVNQHLSKKEVRTHHNKASM